MGHLKRVAIKTEWMFVTWTKVWCNFLISIRQATVTAIELLCPMLQFYSLVYKITKELYFLHLYHVLNVYLCGCTGRFFQQWPGNQLASNQLRYAVYCAHPVWYIPFVVSLNLVKMFLFPSLCNHWNWKILHL